MSIAGCPTKGYATADTGSDQPRLPAILRIRAGPPVAAKDHTIRMNICNLANGIPRDDRSASMCVCVCVCVCVYVQRDSKLKVFGYK